MDAVNVNHLAWASHFPKFSCKNVWVGRKVCKYSLRLKYGGTVKGWVQTERKSWKIKARQSNNWAQAGVWDWVQQSDIEGLHRTCSHAWPWEHKGFVQKNVVFITAHFFWGDHKPAWSICWVFVKLSRTPVAEKRRMWLACTQHLVPPPLFPQTKCRHVRPPLHLPPFSLSSPPSPIFLSLHNWIMGGRGGPIVHCFGFHWFKSSSQSGREGTGEASRHLWAMKGVVEAVNGLRASRGPQWCGGMKYNKPEFTHPEAEAGCSFRRLRFSLRFSTFPPHFPLCDCIRVYVCFFVRCWVSRVRGMVWVHTQLGRHA